MSRTGKADLRWMQWIPLALLAVPFLFIALFAGPAIQSLLVGPVNIWNATMSEPPGPDLAGYYQLTDKDRKRLLQRGVNVSDQSGFKLAADHSLAVIDLPSFDDFGNSAKCHYNGTGHWRTESGSLETELTLDIDEAVLLTSWPNCGQYGLGGFVILGHSTPYRVWFWTEDPDQWNGLTYIRR